MKWNQPDIQDLLKRLQLPQGVVDMVLDTDTYNEVDDQFALCYALCSPERINMLAVYAAPFHNDRSTGPEDGMVKSYNEIVRLLGAMGKQAEGFVFEGSRGYLPEGDGYVDSPAARDLVKKAMARTPDNPLFVVAIGAITNVASAIRMEPAIVDKIHVIWLGGNPLTWTTAREFNLMQDVPAACTVFDCGCAVTLVPCLGVASHLLATIPDVRAYLGGKNEMCDALVELFCAYTDDEFGWAKEIWDVSAIACLTMPGAVPTVLEPSPILSMDCRWSRDASRHPIRVVQFANRTAIFRDMYAKLAKGYQG